MSISEKKLIVFQKVADDTTEECHRFLRFHDKRVKQ